MLVRIREVDLLYRHVVLIVGLVLTILDSNFLFMISSRDPGIIPINSRLPESDESLSASSVEWMNNATPETKLPRTKDILVNGHIAKVKFCDACYIVHHVLLIALSATNVSRGLIITIHGWVSVLELIGRHVGMSRDVVSVILMAYCFVVVWFVGGLSVFHLYLISTNKTTYENFRYRYDKKENPFRGTIKNVKEICLSKTAPLLVNFREMVTEEDNTILRSITKGFGGDSISLKEKDLEVGTIGKDGKPLPDFLQNLDYNGIEDSLKKDKGVSTSTLISFQLLKKKISVLETVRSMIMGTETSSQRNSSAVLWRYGYLFRLEKYFHCTCGKWTR